MQEHPHGARSADCERLGEIADTQRRVAGCWAGTNRQSIV